jgi:PKD domain-containing protein
MRIHRGAIVLFASTTIVLASTLLGSSSVFAAGGSPATSRASIHPSAYVPLRGAKVFGPFDAVFTNLDYNGGPVMPSNTDYMVLWSPTGLGAYPAGYVSGLETYFKDLAHDSGGHQNVDSTSAQYADLTGTFARYKTTFGGVLVVTDPYPATQCPVAAPVVACITDPQLQTELEHIVAVRHLKTDLTHEYFMLTPPNVEGCFTGNPTDNPPFGGCSAGEVPSTLAFYCAYHQNTNLSPLLIYADDPYVVGNPGCDDGNHPNGIADGELSGGLSHEHNESVTDPLPNDAWTNGAGPNHGLENGDQCDGQMGTPLGTHNGAMYNQVINGHFYWYQEEWSNQTHSCLQRLTPATNRPVAKFTVKEGAGLTLKFDATGSSAPGGVADYVWQFNDSFGASTVELTTPNISHTFPSAGAYSVGLTIFASDGTSTGNGGIVRTGHNGITPGFTVPLHPVHGHPATFTGLTNVSAQPVMTYLWEFGDGTTGSGPSPKHTYKRAGTYTLTLVMFSGVGSAFPGAGAGPISTQTITVN